MNNSNNKKKNSTNPIIITHEMQRNQKRTKGFKEQLKRHLQIKQKNLIIESKIPFYLSKGFSIYQISKLLECSERYVFEVAYKPQETSLHAINIGFFN